MKNRGEILKAWLMTVWRAALAMACMPAMFVGVHMLAGGQLRELRYALLLCAAVMLAAAAWSFVRVACAMTALHRACQNLPEEMPALPEALTPVEGQWRALAEGYLGRAKRNKEQMEAQQKERTDYFTLWLHQIKTPLSALDLMAQSAAEVDRTLMRQELLKVNQYASLALSYERLSSIHGDLELERVLLYPLCCQAVRTLRPLFQCGKLRLQMETFDDMPLTDGKWLGVVITQVLTNALKYTPAGGCITVRMAEKDVLEIADTGVGIRAEDVPRVFERGFTGHLGRVQEKSTGIGLYLCRVICDKLGHSISLSSVLGKGTTVRIDMRRKRFDPI